MFKSNISPQICLKFLQQVEGRFREMATLPPGFCLMTASGRDPPPSIIGVAQDVILLANTGVNRVGAGKGERAIGTVGAHNIGGHRRPLAQRQCEVGAAQQVIGPAGLSVGPVANQVRVDHVETGDVRRDRRHEHRAGHHQVHMTVAAGGCHDGSRRPGVEAQTGEHRRGVGRAAQGACAVQQPVGPGSQNPAANVDGDDVCVQPQISRHADLADARAVRPARRLEQDFCARSQGQCIAGGINIGRAGGADARQRLHWAGSAEGVTRQRRHVEGRIRRNGHLRRVRDQTRHSQGQHAVADGRPAAVGVDAAQGQRAGAALEQVRARKNAAQSDVPGIAQGIRSLDGRTAQPYVVRAGPVGAGP